MVAVDYIIENVALLPGAAVKPVLQPRTGGRCDSNYSMIEPSIAVD